MRFSELPLRARSQLLEQRLRSMRPESRVLNRRDAMAAAGLVSLPGMMTGQILAGVPPTEAVRYQILIMFLIVGATGLGVLMTVYGGLAYLTDGRHRLRLDRLRQARQN